MKEENNFLNLYESKNNKEKENKMIYDDKNTNNSFAKKINEYDTNIMNNNEINNENNALKSNLNMNKTMKYNTKNNKLMKDGEIKNNIGIEKINGIFNEYDNYTNLLSQINNINTKYGPNSKLAMSTKNSMINNKANYDIQKFNFNNSNIINNINNYNSNLLNKSLKNEISKNQNLNNHSKLLNSNLNSMSNIERIGGINNYNKQNPISNHNELRRKFFT